MNYLVDSNVYIEAKNRYYRMTFCPGFWDWMDEKLAVGDVGSIHMVYRELADKGDSLADWVKARSDLFAESDSEDTQKVFTDIAEFVTAHPVLAEPHVGEFLSKADSWIIAHACTTGAAVVTHEALAPEDSKRVKIPNVCKQFDVKYCDTFDLLDNLGMQLVQK